MRKALVPENRFGRYFFYAIGEIVLVVIGILIALQVNNWNEERKEYKQIAHYAASLVKDLEEDIKMIKLIKYQAIQIDYRIDSLSKYIRNTPVDQISNLDLLCFTWHQVYRPYSWNRATLDELKSSGSLRLIKNEELSKRIVEYDAFTRHMDKDFDTDKAQSDIALGLLSQVLNTNYPNIDELSELLRILTTSGHIEDVYTSPIFHEAKDYKIDLISNDVNTIYKAVNSYIRLKYNLKIRTGMELPQLIKDAQDIISILKDEYSLSDSDHNLSQYQKRGH